MKMFGLVILTAFSCDIFADDDFAINMQQKPCREDYLGEDTLIDIKRPSNDILELGIISGFTCGTEAAKPVINAWRGNMTLSLNSYSPKGVIALCTCKVEMMIKVEMPEYYRKYAETLYYVQDGLVLGHVNVPNKGLQSERGKRTPHPLK